MMRQRPFHMSRFLAIFLMALPCPLFSYAKNASAQEMVQVQALNFGRFGLRNNSFDSSIIIDPDGTVNYDSAFVEDNTQPARRGEYLLTNLPPNMQLTFGITIPTPTEGGVTIDPAVASITGPGGKSFTIRDFATNNPSTDSSGEATLYIGATLHTSGDNTMYGDGNYDGTIDLTIYF